MKIMRKAVIKKYDVPVRGDEYNVQIWWSIDGGKTYCYCGCGRFCRTEAEAQAYAASILQEEEL